MEHLPQWEAGLREQIAEITDTEKSS
jgi:hypothetical protein